MYDSPPADMSVSDMSAPLIRMGVTGSFNFVYISDYKGYSNKVNAFL